MDEQDKVVVDDRAWIGWNKLPVGVQARILEKLGNLTSLPVEQWPSEEIERWWPNDTLFAIHVWVGADELLVFFYPEGDRIHIDSMLLKEVIDRYARKA